jgi:two-component system sensor histidine kinase DegS
MAQGAYAPQDEVLREFEVEYENIRKRVLENRQLIEQTQLEVGRIRDRHVAVSAQLSRVETNFDTIPRADIKAAYDSAFDVKTRLLTLQGQLEKARATLKELQYFEELLSRLLRLARGMGPDALRRPITAPVPEPGDGDAGRLSTRAIINIVEAQEAERQRLARQMHDGPAQSLTNFILQAEICQKLFDRNPDRAEEELGSLKLAAGATFQKVRDFIFDLRPMMLDDLGLVPTIRRYAEAFEEKTSIATQLSVLGDERRLPSHIEVMMFRSIQAVMGNARDHLNTKSISIVVDVGPEWLKATIEHDGHGFDAREVLAQKDQSDALGLRTLQERIQLVGGALEITSAVDEISRFVILLPAV